MAKFYTDFRDEWVGPGVPTNWTQRINANGGTFSKMRSVTTPGGKVFRIVSTSTGSMVASFNPADNATDVETLVKFRINGTASGRQGIAVHRYSGTSEATTRGYALQFLPASNVRSLLISNDQTGATITFTNYEWTNNTIYWARFRTVGNAIQAKVWPEGSEEPASWMLNTADNAFAGGSGTYNGVGTFTANTTEGVDFMEYAIATEGETATRELPNPPVFPNGYMYRKKLTANSSYLHASNGYSGILNVQGTFPELRPVPAGGKLYNTDWDYMDIRFEDENGTALKWVPEVLNNGTGQFVAWLQQTGMTQTAKRDIYMYYGKPLMTSPSQTTTQDLYNGYTFALWNNGFTEEHNRNQTDWWASRGTVQMETGRHGLARRLQSGDIFKNFEDKYLLRANRTLSMTLKINAFGANNSIQPLYQSTGSGALRLDRASNGQMRLNFVKYGIADQYLNWSPVTGRWYNLQLVLNSNQTATMYIDGVSIGTFPNTNAIQIGNANPSIGGPDGSGQTRPNVTMDTINMVPSARPAWAVNVEAKNMIADDFWSIGAEEISYVNQDQTIDGKFSVQTTSDVEQTGAFRVQTTTDQSVAGRFRVQASYNRTQLGRFRVKSNLTKNRLGRFRVQKTFINNQIGRFLLITLNDYDQNGRFRIASEPSRVQQGIFRVEQTYDETQTGKFSLAIPKPKTQLGRFRVSISVNRTQTGQFTIEVQNSRHQAGKFSVRTITDRLQIGRFRIRTTSDKPQVGKFRVRVTVSRSQIGRFVVEWQGNKHQVGKFRIYDKNTLPEVFIEQDIYKPSREVNGNISEANLVNSGQYKPVREERDTYTASGIDEEGIYR